jgi:hypothetical protein
MVHFCLNIGSLCQSRLTSDDVCSLHWKLESPAFCWDSPFTLLFLKLGRSRCLVRLTWGWIRLHLELHSCWQFYHASLPKSPSDGWVRFNLTISSKTWDHLSNTLVTTNSMGRMSITVLVLLPMSVKPSRKRLSQNLVSLPQSILPLLLTIIWKMVWVLYVQQIQVSLFCWLHSSHLD